jgi:hypothetical protein
VEEDDAPTPTQTQRQRPRESFQDEDIDGDDIEEAHSGGSGSIAQLSKSFVRYALACEYARIPIKRQDVAQKRTSYLDDTQLNIQQLTLVVLGPYSRQFRAVFDAANSQLLDIFGMEMVELPNREKTTMRQKRGRD